MFNAVKLGDLVSFLRGSRWRRLWFECGEREILILCDVHWKKVGAVTRSRSLERVVLVIDTV